MYFIYGFYCGFSTVYTSNPFSPAAVCGCRQRSLPKASKRGVGRSCAVLELLQIQIMQKGLVLSGQVLMFTLDLGLAHRVCMYCGSGRSQAESLFAQARPGHLSSFLPLYHGIVMILLWEIHISHQRGRFWIVSITRHAMLSVCLGMQPYLTQVLLIIPTGVCRT